MLFLVSHGFLLSLAGTGIVLGTLSAYRKAQTVTDAAVTTDIHQTFDVELYLRTAFALHLDTAFGDGVTNGCNLVVVPILYFHVGVHAGHIENPARSAAAYAVDIGKAYFAAFVFG